MFGMSVGEAIGKPSRLSFSKARDNFFTLLAGWSTSSFSPKTHPPPVTTVALSCIRLQEILLYWSSRHRPARGEVESSSLKNEAIQRSLTSLLGFRE